MLFKGSYTLVLKSIVTGEERVLAEVGSSKNSNPWSEFVVDLAGGRALCSFRNRKARVFEVDTGRELEIPDWQRRYAAHRLTGDGKHVIGWDTLDGGSLEESWVSIDVGTGSTTTISEDWPFALTAEGKAVGLASEHRYRSMGLDGKVASSKNQIGLPGCILCPCRLIDDSLAIYDGLASPASHPVNRGGLIWLTFDRSIRLGDIKQHTTMTLVPRFFEGSFAYSPFNVPAP
ncbi:MAG TPA: hypothetical protein VK843_23385 [Planctomycetota bacterium]|nr:hypothetical protein [Planctomycetota bacterium]